MRHRHRRRVGLLSVGYVLAAVDAGVEFVVAALVVVPAYSRAAGLRRRLEREVEP